MKKSICILFFCGVALIAASQKIISVRGEYTYYAPSHMSLDEAKQEALRQTKLHVLETNFGTIINSTTTLIVDNKEGGNSSSNADVRTLSTHEVKGEWIEDTRMPEQELMTDKSMPNAIIIHTRVWGKAREITSSKVDIDVALLKAPYKQAACDVFYNEQIFFLYFHSPISGYLAVYLLDADENTAYCLLPDATASQGYFSVTSNEEYILFKEEPQYMFFTESSVVYNHIAVIFSPNAFYKANDLQGRHDIYSLPRELPLQKYQEWLARCKATDAQLVDKTISVQIVK
jgi:hypothetical protein